MDRSPQTEKSGWWVIYFILLLLISIASLIFGSHSPISLLAAVFNGFGLVGLYGYLTDKAIGWRQFWAVYAGLMFLGAAVDLGPGLWHGLRNDFALFAILVIAAIFTVPQWLAVWRYAFHSSHIWRLPQAAA